jgi:threonylcarbamoyladenosine tRNA methylthiotransferase MtaB
LSRMNRPYDSKEYNKTIERVRDRIDGIGITTDVIVGFPGETDREFKNTCAMIKRVGFSRLHVFRYSPRPRTKAAGMPGQVDAEVKKLRAQKLAELGKQAMTRFVSSHIGNTLEVLVETAASTQNTADAPKQLTGFADNYVGVTFPGDVSYKGKIVRVKIVGLNDEGGAIGTHIQD